MPEKPLIMAFTPSRDPTALQEAADAFVAAVARLSGVPVRAQVASDYAGVVEARDADYDPVRDALELMDYRPNR